MVTLQKLRIFLNFCNGYVIIDLEVMKNVN